MANALIVRKNQLTRFPNIFRAAQYVGMSPDHQRYANQAATIVAYAATHNISIVRTCTDEAQSNLKFESRAALIKLIETGSKVTPASVT